MELLKPSQRYYCNAWLHTRTSVERRTKKWLDNIREDCGDMNMSILQAQHSIALQLGPDKMEKHCLQLGLPEREDKVIVAKAVSQVSQ